MTNHDSEAPTGPDDASRRVPPPPPSIVPPPPSVLGAGAGTGLGAAADLTPFLPPADHAPFLPPAGTAPFAPPAGAAVAPPAAWPSGTPDASTPVTIGGGDGWQHWADSTVQPVPPAHAQAAHLQPAQQPPAPWTELRLDGLVPVHPKATSRSRAGRRVGALVATAALVAGGLASVRLMRSNPAGSASPEAAVERLVHALEARDFLGAVETLPAYDREMIADGLAASRSLNAELGAGDTLTDAKLHNLPGYTLSVTGLETTTESVTDDIAVVTLAGGQFSASLDASSLWKQSGLDLANGGFGGLTVNPAVSGDLAKVDTPIRLATVRDGEGWHVSYWYTFAELARTAAGLPAPDPAERIPATGAASPQSAAREMAEAIATENLRRAIELTPDGEGDVLHDYGPLLLQRVPTPSGKVKITALETRVSGSGDRVKVVVDRLAIEGIDGESFDVHRDGSGCVAWSSDDSEDKSSGRGCIGDLYEALGSSDSPFAASFKGKTADIVKAMTPLFDDAGFSVVRHDGRWFVSPVRSAFSLAIGVAGTFSGMASEAFLGGGLLGGERTGSVDAVDDTGLDLGSDDGVGTDTGAGTTTGRGFGAGPSRGDVDPAALAAQAYAHAADALLTAAVVQAGGTAQVDAAAVHAYDQDHSTFRGLGPDAVLTGRGQASWATDAATGRYAVASVSADGVCYLIVNDESGSGVTYGHYAGAPCHATGVPTTWGPTSETGWGEASASSGVNPWPALSPSAGG